MGNRTTTNPNYLAATQYLFANANTESAAKTIQEIADNTGVSIPTLYRIIAPRNRPAGIAEAKVQRSVNGRMTAQYWFDAGLIATQTREWEDSKQIKEVVMPNSNFSALNLQYRDIAAMNLDKHALKVFDNVTEELKEFDEHELFEKLRGHIAHLDKRINVQQDMTRNNVRLNIIITGLVYAARAIEMGEIDE